MEATFLAIPGAPHPPSSAGDDTRITVNLPARCKRASRRQSRLSVLTLSPADFGINDGAITSQRTPNDTNNRYSS